MANTEKTVTVEQIGSTLRRPKDQRATLVGLGLNKMHRRSTFQTGHRNLRARQMPIAGYRRGNRKRGFINC